MTSCKLVSVLALVMISASHLAAAPLSTAVTYQGQLKDGGAPADGAYDMRFSLFDVAAGGVAVAGPLVHDGAGGNPPEVDVVNGLFNVQLDFGPIYGGTALWLHIEVRTHGVGGYTALTPRQPLTATPFAIFALDGPGQAGFWQANGSSIHKTNSGNVGIGATDPQANLEVRATGFPKLRVAKVHTGGIGAFAPAVLELKSNLTGTDQPYGRINFLDGNDAVRGSIEYGNAPSLAPVSLRLGTAGQTRMAITDAGNVGIGTAAPVHPLDVVGRARIQQAVGGNTAGLWFNQRGPNADRGFVGMRNDDLVGLYGNAGAGWGFVMDVGNGNVGIGTTAIPTGVRLAVRGKVLAEELEVQLFQNWPDYVFADDYDLMPLSELEQRIREKRHLPGIPPAHEVQANGLAVGAMQVKLMEKVEELTLYVIQINRELDDVKVRNAQLERQLAELRGGHVGE